MARKPPQTQRGRMVTGLARRALLVAWPVAEILLVWYVAGLIGWGWVLLILISGVIAAAALLQAAGRNVWQLLADPRRRGQTFTAVDPTTGTTTTLYQPPAAPGEEQQLADELKVRESGLLVTAAALLAVPGFISDVVGVLLMLPPVRRALARRGAQRSRSGATVISGETVEPPQPGPTSAGPDVISGEILPPKPEEGDGSAP